MPSRIPREKTVVITFGRFNPPTTGHAKLIEYVASQAARLGGDAIVFPSVSQDPKKNPLPFQEKVTFLRQFFGNRVLVSGDSRIRTPFDALAALSQRYQRVFVVVGSDRVAEFKKFGNYVRPEGSSVLRGGKYIILSAYQVIPVPGERDADADDVTGMSASKMRAFATAKDFQSFQSGVPTRSVSLAKQLYKSVRAHMGLQESAFFVFGASPRAARPICEALRRVGTTFTDVTGQSYHSIWRQVNEAYHAGRRVRIYARNDAQPGQITESVLRQQTTMGLLLKGLGGWTTLVASPTDARTFSDVLGHARAIHEETGDVIKPKQPSEVDRLKVQQKQQQLAFKQRQSNELLQAQQRELQKKAREAQQKIANGERAKQTR